MSESPESHFPAPQPPQPGLFDDLPPPSPPTALPPAKKRGIGAAEPAADLIELAGAMAPALHLGTSSWSFPGWDGLVYDGAYSESALARNGLAAYARHPLFRTVGIDRTFYAPIGEQDYRRYAAQVDQHFRFLVKAPMAITSSYLRDDSGQFSDSPYYLDPAYAANEFILPCLAGLGVNAGPLVFQFPPQGRDAIRHPDGFINRLYRFLVALPMLPTLPMSPAPDAAYAVEIRDPELMTDRFFTCLKTAGVQFCVASHSRMPSPREQIAHARRIMGPGPLLVRWSLHSGFKYEDAKARYFPFNQLLDEDLDSRDALAAACVEALQTGFPAYVIINNKAEGSAPLSVARLAQQIGAARVPTET